MNKFILPLLLLINYTVFSQDLDYLKSYDTIYISIKNIDTLALKNIKYRHNTNGSITEYHFNDTQINNVTIRTQNDDKFISKQNTKIRKKALNGKGVIDLKFIDKYGLQQIFINVLKVQDRKKVIYVIDEKENTRRKLLLKKASISGNYNDIDI